jgi:hypothetical protein
MLKSQKLHVSVYLRSNIPQTTLVAALDTYDFIVSPVSHTTYVKKSSKNLSQKDVFWLNSFFSAFFVYKNSGRLS